MEMSNPRINTLETHLLTFSRFTQGKQQGFIRGRLSLCVAGGRENKYIGWKKDHWTNYYWAIDPFDGSCVSCV